MKYIKKITVLTFSVLAPALVFGAGLGSKPNNLIDIKDIVISTVNTYIIPILFTVALIVFLWGVANTILKSDSPDGRAAGRKVMVYGLVSLFVIVSIWGIIGLAINSFGF